MAIFTATVSEVTGQGYDLFGGTGTRLLNSRRIQRVETYNTTGSIFKYATKQSGDRTTQLEVKCTDSVATIVGHADDASNTRIIPVSYYPEGDLGVSTETIYINSKDIVVGEDFTSYTSIVVFSGGRNTRYSVSENIAAIVAT